MRSFARLFLVFAACLFATLAVAESPFSEPWRDRSRALVVDAYEHNSIEWEKLISEKRVVGFINKATDGEGEPWNCTDPDTSLEVCRLKFRRYFVAQELYQTRRMLAKAMGLKWGSYHLGRKGNPIAQADHYLAMAKPTDDEVMALDIEGLEDKWMSLEDAQKFVVRIHDKTGRWPMLYVNGSTAKHIADKRADYRILSRLNLWYARFTPEIEGHFPKGNWDKYGIWQFSATPNCNDRRCPQRIPGTPNDIDVNVADMTPDALRAAWPMDDLLMEKPLPVQPVLVANTPQATPAIDVALVPVPNEAPRDTNERPKTVFVAMANIFGSGAMAFTSTPGHRHGTAEIFAFLGVTKAQAESVVVANNLQLPVLDMVITSSVPPIWPPANATDSQERTTVIAPKAAFATGPN